MDNPYSLARVRATNPNAVANRFYIRVRSDEPTLLRSLAEAYPLASTTPLDYEILEGGTYYDDPEIDETREASWVYLVVVPAEADSLRAQGFTVEVLEEMWMDESLPTEAETEGRALSGRATARPDGHVDVRDTVNNQWVPLRKVRVVADQWAVSVSDMTDINGQYSISHAFNSAMGRVKLRLFFENEYAWVNRAINENYMQYLWRAEYTVGEYTVSNTNGRDIYLDSATPQGKLGTTLKSIVDYHGFATANGITPPPQLKVMTFVDPNPGFEGMAPMARFNSPEVFDLIKGILGPIGQFFTFGTVDLLHDQLPDVLVHIGPVLGLSLTESISGTVYHEMAHASHATATGKEFGSLWWQEWGEMIIHGGGYAETPLVDLVESWGYFVGYYLTAERFPTLKTKYIDSHLEHAGFPAPWRIKEDVFYDLIDGVNQERTTFSALDPDRDWDLVSGHTVAEVFSVLKSNTIRSLRAFRNAFVAGYSSGPAETSNIDRVFTGNGVDL